MKKVLAWVLALALVLSTFAMSFATYTDDAAVKASNCEEAVAVLSALGVIEGYDDGSFKPGNDVTRAEMAALIIREMGFSDVKTTGYENDFIDVAKNSWAAGVIQKAVELGLMKGYPDGTFKPAQNVTYNEALTMIVRALGYKDEDLNGSWPQSHVNQARTLDLAKGVSVDELNFQQPAKRGDCAIMLYNALRLPMVSSQTKGLPKHDTFLARLADKIGKEVKLDVEMIVQMCDIAESAVLGEELLGAPITAMTFDGVVAAVQSVDATLYEVEGGSLSSGVFTIDGKDYKLDGAFPTKTGLEVPHFYNGYVSGSDSWNEDAAYDVYAWGELDGSSIVPETVLIWQANKTIQWTEDYAKYFARGDFDSFFFLDKNDAIMTNHFFLKGVDSLDKIAKDDIVTVYFAEPKYIANLGSGLELDASSLNFDKHAKGLIRLFGGSEPSEPEVISKIEVGTKTIEGTASEVNQTKQTVKIEGTDYDIAHPNYCVEDFEDMKLAGKTGTFYLNYRGEVAWFDAEGTTAYFGIYLQGKETKDGDYLVGKPGNKEKKSYAFELFTAAGEDTWFDVAADAAFLKEKPDGKVELEKKDFEKGDKLVKYALNSDEAISDLAFGIGLDEACPGSYPVTVQENRIVDFPVADDVVVFTRSTFVEDTWTVTEFADLDGYVLPRGAVGPDGKVKMDVKKDDVPLTQLFINEDGIVVAIAINDCVASDQGAFLFIEDYEYINTGDYEGYYNIKFVGLDGTFKTNEDWFTAPTSDIEDNFRLAYVTLETNGEVMDVEPADVIPGGYLGMDLDAGEVKAAMVTYASKGLHQGQQYIVGTDKKNYPVTGAKFYAQENPNDPVVEASIDDLAAGDGLVLLQTVDGALQYDTVIIINYV